MNFRDKLARLTAPVSRAGKQFGTARAEPGSLPTALEPRIVPDTEPEPGEIVNAIENLGRRELARSKASAGSDDERSFGRAQASIESGCELLGSASCVAPVRARVEQTAETDEARSQRIARLRGLIGDVLARGGAWRSSHAAGGDFSRKSASPPVSAVATLSTPSRRAHDALAAAMAAAERAVSLAVDPPGLGDANLELPPAKAADRGPGAGLDMLRATIDGWAPARSRLPRVFARQPWATRETPFGPVHVVERWLEPAHRHGRASVHGALERLPATLAALALDPALADLDLSRMLFLDTETTGLAGGSGTVAFLVGIAAFHDDALLVTQLLLPNLGGEVPMLVTLAEHLAAASCILTYNGKSFDWPLLRTRYVMNRLAVPALPPHVDLLHATRRIWKPRLGSVRLTDVEREIMRFSREGDIDGAEIPSRYFSFLHDGGTEWLVPVLEHNQNDVIALPAMLGTLGERFEQIECGDHPLDALAYGRLALRASDNPRAAAFARAAIKASEGLPLESDAWSFCGEVARRARERDAAAQHFEQALELCSEPPRRAVLHVMLAKLYEHAQRDLFRAYRHARFTELAEGPELHGRRLGRLTRKLERRAARSRAAPR